MKMKIIPAFVILVLLVACTSSQEKTIMYENAYIAFYRDKGVDRYYSSSVRGDLKVTYTNKFIFVEFEPSDGEKTKVAYLSDAFMTVRELPDSIDVETDPLVDRLIGFTE